VREMIFQAHWWLDAVAPNDWDELRIEDAGQVLARLPFQVRRRWGTTTLTQPMLCPRLGPWLADVQARPDRQIAEQHARLTALIDRLPRFDWFEQHFSTELTSWLPFYWRGFTQTTLYTNRFESLANLVDIQRNFRKGLRSDIHRLQHRLTIEERDDVDEAYRIVQKSYEHHGCAFPIRKAVLERAYLASRQREAGTLLFAVDEAGAVHAVDFCIWDEHCMHSFMRGRNHPLGHTGAAALLLWHAMQRAATQGLAFDFHGAMDEGVSAFLRGFGAQLTPLSRVTKSTGRYRALNHARTLARSVRRSGNSAKGPT